MVKMTNAYFNKYIMGKIHYFLMPKCDVDIDYWTPCFMNSLSEKYMVKNIHVISFSTVTIKNTMNLSFKSDNAENFIFF